MKRTRSLILTVTAALCLISLSGCVSDYSNLIKGATEVWNFATDKTVTDVYILDDFTLTAVDAPIIKNSPITINGGISITRTLKDNALRIDVTAGGIELTADTVVADAIRNSLGYELDGFKNVELKMRITIKNKQVNMSFEALNLNKFKPAYPASYKTEYRGDMTLSDSSMFLSYMASLMTTGAIPQRGGDYDKSDGVYEYKVAGEKTAQEILRVYKALIDANSEFKLGDSEMPISSLLGEIFGSSDLFVIATDYCTFSDLTVKATKGEEKYFTSVAAACDGVTMIDKDTVSRFRQLLVTLSGEELSSPINTAIRLQGRIILRSEYKIY